MLYPPAVYITLVRRSEEAIKNLTLQISMCAVWYNRMQFADIITHAKKKYIYEHNNIGALHVHVLYDYYLMCVMRIYLYK